MLSYLGNTKASSNTQLKYSSAKYYPGSHNPSTSAVHRRHWKERGEEGHVGQFGHLKSPQLVGAKAVAANSAWGDVRERSRESNASY